MDKNAPPLHNGVMGESTVDKAAKMAFLMQQVEVRSWNGFVEICRALSDDQNRWVFRGQADSAWGLATTFEREARRAGHAPHKWNELEKALIAEFKRGGHRYLTHVPSNELQWLALMQHHGAPTRLLDFSFSPYIAAYHALNGPLGKKFAVYAVHLEKIERATRRVWLRDFSFNSADSELRCSGILQGSAIAASPLVIPVQPTRTHERLAVQQGLFLMQDSLNSTFEQRMREFVESIDVVEEDTERTSTLQLAKMIEEGGPYKKILNRVEDARWRSRKSKSGYFGHLDRYAVAHYAVQIKVSIPYGLRSDFMGNLDQMNINEQSLFPGLDGFARHMKRFVCQWSANKQWAAHDRIVFPGK